jgi:hypothetical protein
MISVQKKLFDLIDECYKHEEVKFDKDVVKFFEEEKSVIEEQTVHIHQIGIREDLMTTFYRLQNSQQKVAMGNFQGTPFKPVVLKSLPLKLPRLD